MPVPANITIISGGQTGADRAALDFAIANGLAHRGWCPRGRRAEDGELSPCYALQETPSNRYSQRTEWNVRDSDATVIFGIKSALTGGTRLTHELAQRLRKPVLVLSRDQNDVQSAASQLTSFAEQHNIRALNVAGPRASQEPEIGAFVTTVLAAAFLDCR